MRYIHNNYSIILLLTCSIISFPTLSNNKNMPAVTLVEQPHFIAHRSGRYAIVKLQMPHRVISTSRVNGGQSESIKYLINHQSMEANNDQKQYEEFLKLSSQEYHQLIADKLNLPQEQITLMGTAANMNNIAHSSLSFRGLRVDAFVTAGITGNALRAGDPARWFQGEDGNEFVAHDGTINTILLINIPLTEGAQANAIITMVEAKSAALAELAVPSTVSEHLATGTGTDQYIIAAPIDASQQALDSTSPHLKIGELIGQAVYQATKEALRWQNGLEPSRTRNILHALGRFGLDKTRLIEESKAYLSVSDHERLSDNIKSITHDQRLAAAAYAYAAILDRIQYKTISEQISQDTLKDQAANVAAALSLQPKLWPEFWGKIKVSEEQPIKTFIQAVALGWEAKWR